MRRDTFLKSIAALAPAVLTGKDFDDFVEYEFSSLRAIMYLSGMV